MSSAERPAARLQVELLIMQLERFFIRWTVHGVMDIDEASAKATLTDMWLSWASPSRTAAPGLPPGHRYAP